MDEEEIKKKALILLLKIAREDVVIYSLQLLQGQEKNLQMQCSEGFNQESTY